MYEKTMSVKRGDVYKKETAPVAEHYRKQGKFKAVDGVGSIDEIAQRLFKAVEESKS